MITRTRLLVVLLLLSCTAMAQQEVSFKVAYKPGKTYNSRTKTVSYAEMDFQGDEAAIEQIKANGISLPVIMESVHEMAITTQTGARTGNGEMPVTMVYDTVNIVQKMNGQEMASPNPLAGVRIEGRIDTAGKTNIDSIHGDVSQELKQTIEHLVQTLQEQVKFPEHPMKAGEKFVQEVPLKVPVGGMMAINMIIKMTYTLKSIKDQKALFDLVQEVSLDFSMEQANATATGSGDGHMIFDLEKNFITSFDSEVSMDMKMKFETMELLAKSKTTVEQNVQVE